MSPWVWLPNALSIGRLVLALAFPFVPEGWRLPVVIAGALSDWLDGALSRWLRAESDLGRLLDPVADKLFVLSVLLTLLTAGLLTLGEVVLLGVRDLAIGLGSVWVLTTTGRTAAPRLRPALLGKATTLGQLLVLLVVLSQGRSWLFAVLLVVTIVLGVLATIDYGRRYWKQTQSVRPETRSPEEG